MKIWDIDKSPVFAFKKMVLLLRNSEISKID
jgi:hypothetical protein